MNAKNNTTGGKPQSKQSKDEPGVWFSYKQLKALSDSLKPMIDFHKEHEDATENDFRLFWDVRLVRGGNTLFSRSSGTSTLPSFFSENRLLSAPGNIEREVIGKILDPLSARIQEEVDKLYPLVPDEQEGEIAEDEVPVEDHPGASVDDEF